MRFVGVDLAWKVNGKKETAIVVLNEKGKVIDKVMAPGDRDIVSFLEELGDCAVGIDAPAPDQAQRQSGP